MTPAPPPGAAGFTLLETLVVVAIFGLAVTLTAMALPRRGGSIDVDAAAEGIAARLRLARATAIAQAEPVAVAPAQGGYRAGALLVRLPPGVALQFLDRAAIVFTPDGAGTGGRVLVVGTARQVAVGVDWLTGRVDVRGAQ